MENEITSTQNPKVKQVLKLKKASQRKKQDLILIEGRDEVMTALKAGIEIITVFLCVQYNHGTVVPKTIEPGTILNTSAEVFIKLSRREHPDGWLAVARPHYQSLEELKLSRLPLVIIFEEPEKPGNLGAIIRSAAAAGVDAVIVTEVRTDIYNPNVIRASRGAVFNLPIAVTNNENALTWLEEHKIKTFAATDRADKLYMQADFTGPTAIVVGTEHEGLSGFWLKRSQEKIKIPMLGKVNSLNASVSAGILIYEALRQRAKDS